MFEIVDTAFGYEREVIIRSFLQDFSKGKESTLQLICNAHTAFLLGRVEPRLRHSVGMQRIIHLH